MPLVSHHPPFYQKMFYKKNSAIFLVFSVKYYKFCSLKPMARHIQFLSHFHDLKSFDYDKNVLAFFSPNCLISYFRLMPLVSHHPPFHQKMFYKKNSAIFLVFSVNYSKFCSLKPMARHIQFLSHFHDLKSFDYDKTY